MASISPTAVGQVKGKTTLERVCGGATRATRTRKTTIPSHEIHLDVFLASRCLQHTVSNSICDNMYN